MRATWIVCCLLGTGCSGGDGGTDDNGGDDGGGGGGVNEDNFGAKYLEKYCAEYEDCSGESDCPLTTMTTPPTGTTLPTAAECDFDEEAANDCLDGEWTCSTFYGFTVVIPPPSCCAVCGDEPCPTTPVM